MGVGALVGTCFCIGAAVGIGIGEPLPAGSINSALNTAFAPAVRVMRSWM
jgi:hypothetical protein